MKQFILLIVHVLLFAFASSSQTTKIIYTCPMHPEVKSNTPGKCPKCGMALEKKTVKVNSPKPAVKKPVQTNKPKTSAPVKQPVQDPSVTTDTMKPQQT